MPGWFHELTCPACAETIEVRTGSGSGWTFEQFVCHRCRTLQSVPVAEAIVPGSCPACGLQLEPWSGRVREDARADRIAGPCPRCYHDLDETDATMVRRWE